MYDHWPNDDDCCQVGVSVMLITGQMAMTVPSWCFCPVDHWPNGDDCSKLAFLSCFTIAIVVMTVPSWCFCHVDHSHYGNYKTCRNIQFICSMFD